MHDPLDSSWAETLSPPAHEHRTAVSIRAGYRVLAELKIASEGEDGPRPHRHDSLLPAFPSHLQLIGEKVEILQVHAAELGEADARGVEELEYRQISGWTQLVAAGPRFGPLKESLGLAAVEISWQTLLQLWYPGCSRDVVGDSVMFLEEPVEAPHRRKCPGSTP